jgi:hypothetical protein
MDSHVHITFALGREGPNSPMAEKIVDSVMREFWLALAVGSFAFCLRAA